MCNFSETFLTSRSRAPLEKDQLKITSNSAVADFDLSGLIMGGTFWFVVKRLTIEIIGKNYI